jgi:1-acyl-sn-glycerol-3-phosphate acyltransferase
VRHGRIGFWYRLTVSIVQPLSMLLTRREWRGAENIPAQGGVIVAANHLSYVDPMTFGHFVYASGRTPRFLAKSSLFEVPVFKYLVRGAGQIPVYRGTDDAAAALSAGVDALRRGECLLIYPEGTATRDPDCWPMQARTGVARCACRSGGAVGPAGTLAVPHETPASVAPQADPGPGGTAGRSFGVRRTSTGRAAASRGDRDRHGADHRSAR